MTEFNEKDLSFVARHYDKRHYDTRKAIARFHEMNIGTTHRRWWMTAAAAAASVVLVFAAGYGIRIAAPAAPDVGKMWQALYSMPKRPFNASASLALTSGRPELGL